MGGGGPGTQKGCKRIVRSFQVSIFTSTGQFIITAMVRLPI